MKEVLDKSTVDLLSILAAKERSKKKTESLILKNTDSNVSLFHFIRKHINLYSSKNHIISTATQFNIEKLKGGKYSSITNIKKINDVRYINKFFRTINSILSDSGLYFGSVETYPNRRKVILDKYPPILNLLLRS